MPNLLTFPALFGALLVSPWLGATSGPAEAAAGAGLGFALLVGPYAIGGMGAGDVKALMALGAWLGPEAILGAAAWALLAAGGFGLFLLALRGELVGFRKALGTESVRHADLAATHLRGAACRIGCGPRHSLRRGPCDRGGGSMAGRLPMVKRIARAARRQHSEDGTSVVEMAFVLPLLLLLVFAIGDFGIAYTRWNSLTNAVREGARVGVVFRAPCNAAAVTAEIQNTVSNFAASSGLDGPSIVTTVANVCGGYGYTAHDHRHGALQLHRDVRARRSRSQHQPERSHRDAQRVEKETSRCSIDAD